MFTFGKIPTVIKLTPIFFRPISRDGEFKFALWKLLWTYPGYKRIFLAYSEMLQMLRIRQKTAGYYSEIHLVKKVGAGGGGGG